ncbi:MAG TPA: LysR substrate-binding domain-containing protein, partial [Nocardioides sp.]|nr:LysR substrate-binding domain-containing protein [Nocardioides sp.]
FVRSPSGTRLTPVGEAVAAWAKGVVDAARALTDGIATLRSAADARLRVAASLTVAEYLLPLWLLTLRARHPEAEVAATVANSHGVTDRVLAGEVDLGLIEAPELPDGVTGQQVGTDEVVLVVGAGYPLAARAGSGVRASDIADLTLLVREEGSGTRDTFVRSLGTALGGTPALTHATSLGSTATILATARAGGGVGVVSARAAAADIAAGTLVRVPVADLVIERPLTAVWMGRRPTPLAQELIGIAAARSGH